jgi:hypothetical protein
MVIAIIVTTVVVGAVSFQVSRSPETASGVQNTAQFLLHFQEAGGAIGRTPARLPTLLSTVVTAPTRLPGFSAARLLNAGVRGDFAATWVFHETAGITVNTEIELRFQITYQFGAAVSTYLVTSYVETQAAVIAGTLTFTVYWDSAHLVGVTVHSQLELSQVCAAVGACP